MPIYEYKCQECGSHFERRQSVAEEPLKTCEKCGGKLEKQWSLSGFQFKGAGWYVTDYSKKSAEKSDKKESGEKTAASESTAKSDGASNTKADAPKETVTKKD